MTGTAKIYDTTLTLTKLEVLQRWLPTQHWFDDDPASLETIGSYLRHNRAQRGREFPAPPP